MSLEERSAAERILRVPIRDEIWDTLYRDALEIGVPVKTLARIIIERHYQRSRRAPKPTLKQVEVA